VAIDQLLNVGAIGVVLAWFMFRMERKLDRMSYEVNRLTRAVLLEIVSRPGVSRSGTREAEELLRDLAHDKNGTGG
jgi:hypothetical protein